MRDPPEGLRNFAENNRSDIKIPMPTYLGSNTQYLSIPFLRFNLRGQGNFREMYIDPPILTFPDALVIGKEYSQTISIKKKVNELDSSTSDSADVTYKKSIKVEGKSDDSFEVKIDSTNFDKSSASDQDIDVEVTIMSSTVGVKSAYLMIDIEDGVPLSYFIQARFEGPLISLVEPNVEFGLQKINSHSSFTMNIKNHSEVEATILIKNAHDFMGQSFNSCYEQYQQELKEEENKDEKQKPKSKLHKFMRQMMTRGSNKITFQPQYLVIPANSRGEITVNLQCNREEEISEILEIMVKDSDSHFIKLKANIQKLKICLNRYNVNLGKIYAGIKQNINSHHDQRIVLKNYGNIPAKFQWDENFPSNQLKVMFDPARGTIAPHSEFVVNIKLTAYQGGQMNMKFICDVTDLDFPLGFRLSADVFGLRVAHIVPDYIIEAQKAAATANLTKSKLLTSTDFVNNKVEEIEEEDEQDEDDVPEKLKLKALKFPSCTINKPSSQKFILRNLSGIKTEFRFWADQFQPDDLVLPSNIQGVSALDELPKQDMDETVTISKPGSKSSKRETKIRFAMTNKSKKGLKVKQLKRALLSDSHERMNKFSSKTGETFTATKRLEREQAFYLSNNKGLAVVFSPAYGELKPHAEIPINVTIYNNACGRFEDTFVSEIKGLGMFQFPVHVSISGSPLIIPENQVGLNYVTSPPTMAFPTIVNDSPPISKMFKIKNTGIDEVYIDWKFFDERDQKNRNSEADFFNITIAKNTGFDSEENPFRLNFDLIEPEPSKNSPFQIHPEVAVIPSRQTEFFEVFFSSDQGADTTFKSVLLAHPKLAKDPEVKKEIRRMQHGNEEGDQPDDDITPEKVGKGRGTVDLYDYNSDSSAEENRDRDNSQDIEEFEVNNQFNQHDRSRTNSDGEEDVSKRPLGIVALNLIATTITPVLSVDMKQKFDGEFYFNFYQWPMDHEDEPSPIQKICLVNETKANIIFNLNTEGPFRIIGTKTNSGSAHPLAAKRPSSKGVGAKPETMFSLQPDKIVQLKVEFLPPSPTNSEEWPVVRSVIKKGKINVTFANGKTQFFNLLGNLIRPRVSIVTQKPCKNEKGTDEIDLGEVNIEKQKQTLFYLTNETAVPAKWSLNYVKFPKKKTIGYMTKTPLEIENLKMTDDPDVFQFSITSGCLRGPSIPLRVTPEGAV